MNRSARESSAHAERPWFKLSSILMVAGLILLSGPATAQEARVLQNHVLGIGNCPPWHPQSVEVCRHSLEKVMHALAPRVNAGPDNTHVLINEGASAVALKRKATELANKLGAGDRLIIYTNLPLASAAPGQADTSSGYFLELWAPQKPESPEQAVSKGTWISAPAFAAMIHAIPAAEVILVVDTNNPHAISLQLLDEHSVDLEGRPEALVSSSGAGQAPNYSADRTISLFAKHLSLALDETEGSLLDVMTVAAGGTRQAAIPICADLMVKQSLSDNGEASCAQIPEIHDPEDLLSRTNLAPLPETEVN